VPAAYFAEAPQHAVFAFAKVRDSKPLRDFLESTREQKIRKRVLKL
jgi:hypothetical protein